MPLSIRSRNWGRAVVGLLCLVCVVVVVLAGCGARGGTPVTSGSSETATPLPPVKADTRVVADGRVVPVRSTDLGLAAGGIVSEISVREGEQVVPGQLLLRLNAARQNANVAQAAAEVRRAVARLEEVQAGSRAQEIASAQAGVDAAQARLDAIKEGPSREAIAAAEADVAAAQAALRKALAGASQEEIIAAQAELANADAVRRQAQAAYDQVAGSPNIGSLPQALQLEQATNNYNAAKARYENLLRGPNQAEIASARAQVERAQAALDALKVPASAADLAEAEAEVRRAQAQLDLVLAGAPAEQLAAADADVAAAEAALAQARAALAEMELRAPFSGTVALVDVTIGQQVSPGYAAVRLADFSGWIIETADLTELKVVGITEGDTATVTFDAIPGLSLPAHVTRIRFIGESRQGDVIYTVIVVPDFGDDRLRWNMTAKVTIEPGTGVTAVARVSPTAPAVEVLPDSVTPTAVPIAPTGTPESLPATATAAPTPTEMPVAIATPTSTPAASTLAPPATLAPAVTTQATRPAAPRTPVRTATLRPATTRATPVLALSAPALVEPPQNDSRDGVVVFRWQPTGPLPSGAAYEVVWWAVDEDPLTARGLAEPITDTALSINLDVLSSSGQFRRPELYWTVLIVQTTPYTRLTQPSQGGARLLFYTPPVVPPPPPPRGG